MTNRAVFLSYASQDAEAARRICEALRAAGVEVWFDQSELRGGDAWDAKIRKQIKECALFVPLVSANTQARREGYFRLEWKLAEDRSHLMAKGTPFIVPVCIDDTKDWDALVPDSFMAVQWTRLRGGETPPTFCERIKALAAGPRMEEAPVRRAAAPSGRLVPDSRSPGRIGLIVFAVALLVAAGWLIKNWTSTPSGGTAKVAESSASFSEARKLVEKARAVFEEGDLTNRETYVLTEALLKKAEELDVTEAEAWALHAEVSRWLDSFGFDSSAERQAAMKAQAERALKLAPNSVSARLAYANMLLLTGGNTAEAERMLNSLLAERPDDWRVLRVVGGLHRRNGKSADAIEILRRARRLSDDHQAVVGDLLTVLVRRGDYAEAESVVAESLARRINGRVLEFDVRLKLNWRGDAAAAAAALERWPSWMFTEDRGVQCAAQVLMWNRQPARALAVAARFPRDYIRHNRFTGPRAALTAWLHELAGNTQAAQSDWKTALQVADRELAAAPASADALHWKAWALARLGARAAAERSLKELIERKVTSFYANETTVGLVALALVAGQTDWAFSELERLFAGTSRREEGGTGSLGLLATRAVLDLNPAFDGVRGDPRFKGVRDAARAPEVSKTSPLSSAAPDPKSIVVLPFANLSGDPAQEYFSDGLTEEILNALSNERDLRVPGRTSAFAFKEKSLTAPEIARALNVAQVVEGSVRKSGDQVRIAVTLTRAADGFSEPLGSFNEKQENIFTLQEKVARAVVAKITRRTTTAATLAVQTRNPAAYDAYLRGRAAQMAGGLRDETHRFYQEAIRLDPHYALPWARLSQEYERRISGAFDRSEENRARAREAAAEALRLAPDLPEAHFAMAAIRLGSDYDPTAAQRELDQAVRVRPNDPEAPWIQARIDFTVGRWAHLGDLILRAAMLDSQNVTVLTNMGGMLSQLGRFADAEDMFDRVASLNPKYIFGPQRRASNHAAWTGDVAGALQILAPVAALMSNADLTYEVRGDLRAANGDVDGAIADYEEARKISARQGSYSGPRGWMVRDNCKIARLELRRGNRVRADAILSLARREAEQFVQDFPKVFDGPFYVALVLALQGEKTASRVALEAGGRMMPQTSAHTSGVFGAQGQAQVLALLGDTDAALEKLRTLHEKGHGFGYRLRTELDWEPLRGDARFQQLMKEAEARADAVPRPNRKP